MNKSAIHRTSAYVGLFLIASFSVAANPTHDNDGVEIDSNPVQASVPPPFQDSTDAIDDAEHMIDVVDGVRVSAETEMVMMNDEIVYDARKPVPEAPKVTEAERNARRLEFLRTLPKSQVHGDIDGNKLFEDLEDSLSRMADTDTIKIFVHLNDLVESIGTESLEKAYGSFSAVTKFTIIPKIFWAEMNKSTLMKLRDDPRVLYIEPEKPMQPQQNTVHNL